MEYHCPRTYREVETSRIIISIIVVVVAVVIVVVVGRGGIV
jgi:t-SNARE complex subunit (syntaxin)